MTSLADLTEDEILAMEAGPDIDALIATEVMGWKRRGEWPMWCTGPYSSDRGNWMPSENLDQAFEAEEAIPGNEIVIYASSALHNVVNRDRDATFRIWNIAHASALDRCRAILMWKKRSQG